MKKLIVIMCIFSASVMYGQDVFIETGLNLTEYNYKDPQGENIPKEWVQMIANGDDNLAKEIKTELVHKLGNLTLTAYNSKLSNMSFERKKTRQQDGKNIGYLNGLWLNEKLKDENSWTADDIKVRTELLVDKALKLFSFG